MRPFAADVVDTLCGEASRDAEKQTPVLYYWDGLCYVSKLSYSDIWQQNEYKCTEPNYLYTNFFLSDEGHDEPHTIHFLKHLTWNIVILFWGVKLMTLNHKIPHCFLSVYFVQYLKCLPFWF